MTREDALKAMLATEGRFFAVEFVKVSTGEKRLMNCRLGVMSHLKGEPQRDWDGAPVVTFYDHNRDLVLVWDAVKKAYRSFKLASVVRLKVAGEWQQVEG